MDWFPISIPTLSNFSLPFTNETPPQEGGMKLMIQEEYPDSPIEETVYNQFMNTRKKNKTRKQPLKESKKDSNKDSNKDSKKESKERNPRKTVKLRNKPRTRKAVKKLRVRKTKRT